MTTSEVLRKAAEYIEEHGWIRYWSGHNGGPRCAVGTLWSVTGELTTHGARLALEDFLGEPLVWWNDAPGRTAEEVIAKLREVADKLDAEAGR